MEKILNILKYNTYGLSSMINKYVFMERHDINNNTYFIFQIKTILNDKFPIKYQCNRLYVLNIPKDKNKKAYVYDNLTELELTNNDTLFQLTFDEYLKYFKAFIDISDTSKKSLSI
jgi:hypothetical protein